MINSFVWLSVLHVIAVSASAGFKSRATLQLENVALRHQLGVLRRSLRRPRLTSADRLLWSWLSEVWSDWRSAVLIVKPETIIAWHRKGFRLFWTWKVRHGQAGRPPVPKRNPSTDSDNEPRQSALGCATHPRRIAQTRHRHWRDQRGQVHRAPSEAAVANLAHISGYRKFKICRKGGAPGYRDRKSLPK